MQYQDVIIKPVVSEKSFKDAGEKRYTFLVKKAANKHQIKEAVEKIFNVKVAKVNTNSTKGSKTTQTKQGTRTKQYTQKKAWVQLVKGQRLNIFEEEE